MSLTVSQLNALTKLFASNPSEAKALVKLLSVDVLKSLGKGKYTIALGDKTLSAQSDKPLQEGSKYWAQLTQTKSSLPQLSNLVKTPKVFQTFQSLPFELSVKDLQNILSSKQSIQGFKKDILEHLTKASSKEEFSSLSNLLLSLQNNTLSVPMYINMQFYLLQMKKRYNNKTKKTYLDFYAALESLGPISGVISHEGHEIEIDLSVAYEKTKQFLEQDLKNFSYKVNITVQQEIQPLYENSNTNSLLDISI